MRQNDAVIALTIPCICNKCKRVILTLVSECSRREVTPYRSQNLVLVLFIVKMWRHLSVLVQSVVCVRSSACVCERVVHLFDSISIFIQYRIDFAVFCFCYISHNSWIVSCCNDDVIHVSCFVVILEFPVFQLESFHKLFQDFIQSVKDCWWNSVVVH